MAKVSEKYNLQVMNPGLAKEWHPKKNGNLTPEDVTPGSKKRVWWVCEKGHEWETTVYIRNRLGTVCPRCRRLGFSRVLKDRFRGKKTEGAVINKVGNTPTGNILAEVSPDVWKKIKNGIITPEQIGPMIMSYRRKHGLTQKDCGEKIGLGRNRISQIERGIDPDITVRTYRRIIAVIAECVGGRNALDILARI